MRNIIPANFDSNLPSSFRGNDQMDNGDRCKLMVKAQMVNQVRWAKYIMQQYPSYNVNPSEIKSSLIWGVSWGEAIYLYRTISVHLNFGLIWGVVFGERGLSKIDKRLTTLQVIYHIILINLWAYNLIGNIGFSI